MLQTLHKIFAVILAFVVVFSTLSFSVEQHICMGEVTDVSFFAEADSCEMETDDCDTNNFYGTQMQKENCCNNIQELIPGNQIEQQAVQKFEVNQAQFILAYTYFYQNLFKEKKDRFSFIDYSPPLVDKDINTLYQTFLI